MKIWITTDTHFGHDKLIEYGRPVDFEKKIKDELKRVVREDDLLIHIGDVCIGNDKENNNWFKNTLGCKTYLIRGNHDNKSIGWYLKNGWDVVADRLDIYMFKKKIAFTHIPAGWDGHFDINVHGHLHDCNHRMDVTNGYNKLISLENTNYKPVELKKIIN